MYNQIAIQPQNIKSCNQSPTHHPIGVGLHAQPGLSGHLMLTCIIQLPYTNTPTSCRRGQTNRQTDRETDRQTDRHFISINHSLFAITTSQPNMNTPNSALVSLLESTCIATDNACKLVINLIFNTIIYRIYIQYGYL